MCVREGGRRAVMVAGLVRSAAMRVRVRAGVWGDGEAGSVRSVRVRVEMLGEVERREARAWPRKPAAPVRRMFILWRGERARGGGGGRK